MTPELAMDFQNGTWAGNIQLASFASQVSFGADDGNGSRGRSAPFPVGTADDLAVSLTVDPGQADHPAHFVHYRAEVTHCCEVVSSNVVVEIRLPSYFGSSPASVNLVQASQGVHEIGAYSQPGTTQPGILVRARFGELGFGQRASIEFEVSRLSQLQPLLMATNLTATATATRTQPEQNVANNAAEAVLEINTGCALLPPGAFAWWRGDMSGTNSLGQGALQLVGSPADFLAYGPGRAVGESAFSLARDRGFQSGEGFQWELGANQDFALEFWVRTVSDNLRDRIVLLDKRDATSGVGFVLFLDQGRLGTTLTDTAGNSQSHFTRTPAINAADLRDGRWHHVALSTRRAPQARNLVLAIDGSFTALTSGLEVTGDLGNAPLRIGFEAGAGTETALVGLMDEITLYNTALESASLSSLARAGGAGKCLANVSLAFASPRPENGQFPDPFSYGRPLAVSLTVTNRGPLAIPATWVAVVFGELGSVRLISPSVGTNVLSPFMTYHDLGPLAAGTGRLFEVEITLTNILDRLYPELAAMLLNVGQGYRMTSDIATFRINPDGDSDGADDRWELTNGFDPLNAADATADTDGDGFRNVDEFQLGTDPRSATDVLKLELSAADTNGVRFRFPGKSGKSYGLFRRANLGDPWSEVSRFTATENAMVELIDATPPTDAAFYQIQLMPNP